MENQQEDIKLSYEQQERKEKFDKLFLMMLPVFQSIREKEDSIAASALMELMNDEIQKFKNNNLKLRGFLAGRIFLDPKVVFVESDEPFDTEDGEIENTIYKVYKDWQKEDESRKQNQPK